MSQAFSKSHLYVAHHSHPCHGALPRYMSISAVSSACSDETDSMANNSLTQYTTSIVSSYFCLIRFFQYSKLISDFW